MQYLIPPPQLNSNFSWLIGTFLTVALIAMLLVGLIVPKPGEVDDACKSTSNHQLSAPSYVLIFIIGNLVLCPLAILAVYAQGTHASNSRKLTVMVSEIVVFMFNITIGFALVAALSSQSDECREKQSNAFYWVAVCIAAFALIMPTAYVTVPVVTTVFFKK